MSESVPNRANDPKRKLELEDPNTFICENCGKKTPLEERGMEPICDDCFYNEEGYECSAQNAHTGEPCDFDGDRADLEEHWNGPDHNCDHLLGQKGIDHDPKTGKRL